MCRAALTDGDAAALTSVTDETFATRSGPLVSPWWARLWSDFERQFWFVRIFIIASCLISDDGR